MAGKKAARIRRRREAERTEEKAERLRKLAWKMRVPFGRTEAENLRLARAEAAR